MRTYIIILVLLMLNAGAARPQQPFTNAPTDMKSARLGISVDPAQRYISGCATLTFGVDEPCAQLPIEIELSADYIINSITGHGDTALYYYRHNDNLRIYPRAQWNAYDSITVHYCGEPPCSGLGSVMFETHDNTPIFWTLSEPFGAKDWWPCKQDINDKIDSTLIIITCPERYRSVANGMAVSETIKDGLRTTCWAHHYPIAYHLICAAVTNYRTYSEWYRGGSDSVEVVNYVYPEKYDQWRRRTYRLMPAFKMLCDSFGAYPFRNERYGQAQFGWSGGMEHQGISFLGSANVSLMIHELAHQWFGNMITANSWADVFLHEGFATYCEMLAIEKDVSISSDPIQWRRSCINMAGEKPNEALHRMDTSNVEALFDYDVVYSKGAMVLHLLRREIGDQKFFKCIKSYLSNPLIRYGNASLKDFTGITNIISGRNLDWFFRQWYYGAGLPKYHIQWHQNNGNLVSLTVSQTTSDTSVAFFRAKIPFLLHGINGEKTLFWLNNTTPNQHFSLNPGFPVSRMEFDPYCDVLKLGAEISAARGGRRERKSKRN